MQIEHSNEIDLIRETLAGDTSAFDRLVKTHRSTVYVVVISYIKNPADAEDLTQRIFIRAYERLATLRQLDRFLPWIQQIAHNICKDWLRQRNDSTTSFEAVNHADFVKTAPSPEEIALKREIETLVREAIGALKETDRKLVEGRYIEGASYDELQAESGLSYAAIANRLKRAKQEMRRRIEKLLGGMVILPGRILILGGIETVKLSVKTKLAAVGVAAVLGIGGGSALYHHTSESNPVSESQSATVNTPGVSETEAVIGNSSTSSSSQRDATLNNNSPKKGSEGESNRVEDVKVKTVAVDTENMDELSEELEKLGLSKEVTELIHALAKNHAQFGGDGKVFTAATTVVKSDLTEEKLTQLPIEIRQAIKDLKIKNSGGARVFKIENGQKIPEDIGQAIDELTKQRSASGESTELTEVMLAQLPAETRQALENLKNSGANTTTVQVFTNEALPEHLRQKIADAGVPKAGLSTSVVIKSQTTTTNTLPGGAELTPQSTDSVLTPSDPTVESSTTTPTEPSETSPTLSDEDWAEFEKLVSDFSDEDWAEFERLLRSVVDGEPPQRATSPSLGSKRQRQQQVIEKVGEKTPITPSVLQELQKQQRRVPPQRDANGSPRPKNADRREAR